MKKIRVSKKFVDKIKECGLKIEELSNTDKEAIHKMMYKNGLSYHQARKIIMAKGGK